MADVTVNGKSYPGHLHIALTGSRLGYHRIEWPGKTACGLASTNVSQLGLLPENWPSTPCGTCFPVETEPRTVECQECVAITGRNGLVHLTVEPDPPYEPHEIVVVHDTRGVVLGIERHPLPGPPKPGRNIGLLVRYEGDA